MHERDASEWEFRGNHCYSLYFHTFRCSIGNVESKDQLETMKRQKFQLDK